MGQLHYVFLLFSIMTVSQAAENYKGYTVFRTGSLNVQSADKLMEYVLTSGFDVWREPKFVGHNADIMVSPERKEMFQNFLISQGIAYTTMVEDVQKIIDGSSKPTATTRVSKGLLDFTKFHPLNDIYDYMDKFAETEDWINVESIGQSYEGRDMKVITITKAGEGAPNVWIEAGIHAREWIAPAMATYFISQLLENKDTNPDYLDKLNFYILPSANPDGYEFSQTNDRLWRKNRNDTGSSSGCKGVDLNRNWGFHFGESGVSSDKCAESYPGEEAFSEVESRNIRDYVNKMEPVPVLAHCLHSYSQLWMYPYGYAYYESPENVEELIELGADAVAALEEVNGKIFDNIVASDLYPAAGASDDWYAGVLKSRFVYTTELRDTGKYGFILPADQIIPSGEELWAAEEVVLKKMLKVSA